jgi:hypothetical protein
MDHAIWKGSGEPGQLHLLERQGVVPFSRLYPLSPHSLTGEETAAILAFHGLPGRWPRLKARVARALGDGVKGEAGAQHVVPLRGKSGNQGLGR